MSDCEIKSSVPEGITPEVRTGTKFVCELPDAGPWRLARFSGRLFASSVASGLWELVDGKLVRVDCLPAEEMPP